MAIANRALIFSLIVFILSPYASVSARPQGHTIRGKVRNSSGRNVAQVMVQLETGNGLPVNTTTTNNEGDFYFSNLSGTSYIIVISAPDYSPAKEHVDFVRTTDPDSPGEQRTVEVTLVPIGGGTPPLSNRTVPGQNVPKEARDALDRAMKLSKENKLLEAVAAMQEAIKAYPDYSDAHFLLGNTLLNLNRIQEALPELEHARRINPRDDRVYQSFGQLLVKQGKYALASQVFAEAARLNPTDANIPLMRAVALIEHAIATNASLSKEAAAEQQNAFGMAEKDLARAFELSGKKLAVVHLQAARLYEKKGERARAADELEQYLKMAPSDQRADAIRSAIQTLRTPPK